MALALVVSGCDDGDSVRTAVVVRIEGAVVCAQPEEYPVYCFRASSEQRPELAVGSCITTRSRLDEPVGGDGTPERPEQLISLKASDGCNDGG